MRTVLLFLLLSSDAGVPQHRAFQSWDECERYAAKYYAKAYQCCEGEP